MSVSLRRRVLASLAVLCAAVPAASAADRGSGRVDLRVRVVTPYREFSRAFWNVSVSASAVEPQQEVTESGRWIVFRRLAPADYTVCVTGVRGRRTCTALSLPEPSEGSRPRLDVDIEAPRAAISQADLRRPPATLATAEAAPGALKPQEGFPVESDTFSDAPTAAAGKQPTTPIR